MIVTRGLGRGANSVLVAGGLGRFPAAEVEVAAPPSVGGGTSTNAWRQQRAYLDQENLKIALSISIGVALDLM